MRGVYLTFVPQEEGQTKLIPRLEYHVILPELGENDVLVHVKACALGRIDIKTLLDLYQGLEQIAVGREISGIVAKVGANVSRFAVNDLVAGILPLDSECPGCAEYCTAPEYCLVKKPPSISHVECAAVLSPLLRAYTALHCQARLSPNSTLLLFSAATAEGIAMINLCSLLDIKVIAVVNSAEEADKLSQMEPSIYKVVNSVTARTITDTCRYETGGMGVACVIDSGVSPGYSLGDFTIDSEKLQKKLEKDINRYEYETTPTSTPSLPTKQEIINCLSPMGQWISSQPDLQLNTPETKLLHLKAISVHFLFESVWNLSGAQQGQYLHILDDALQKLSEGKVKACVRNTIGLGQVTKEIVKLGGTTTGRIVMTTESN